MHSDAEEEWERLSREISAAQRQVVEFMGRTGGRPFDAVRAGLCNNSSVTRWTSETLHAHAEVWRRAHPNPGKAASKAARALVRLVPAAVQYVADVLTGAEPPQAVRMQAARYVLDHVERQAQGATDGATDGATPAVAELAHLLRAAR